MNEGSMGAVLQQLNWLDILLLFLLISSVIASLVRGFTREIAGLVALILGIVLGLWFHGVAGSFVREYVASEEIASMVGFTVIFFGVVLLGGIVGFITAKMLSAAGLSLFDRLLGGAFGLAKGMLFGAVIVFALLAFTPGGTSQAVSNSRVAPYVLWSANVLAYFAPAEVKTVVFEKAARIKAFWEGAEPELPVLPQPAESATRADKPAAKHSKSSPMGN